MTTGTSGDNLLDRDRGAEIGLDERHNVLAVAGTHRQNGGRHRGELKGDEHGSDHRARTARAMSR